MEEKAEISLEFSEMMRATAFVEFGVLQKRVVLVDIEINYLLYFSKDHLVARSGFDVAENGLYKIWVINQPSLLSNKHQWRTSQVSPQKTPMSRSASPWTAPQLSFLKWNESIGAVYMEKSSLTCRTVPLAVNLVHARKTRARHSTENPSAEVEASQRDEI